jgi:hypothetical protein
MLGLVGAGSSDGKKQGPIPSVATLFGCPWRFVLSDNFLAFATLFSIDAMRSAGFSYTNGIVNLGTFPRANASKKDSLFYPN